VEILWISQGNSHKSPLHSLKAKEWGINSGLSGMFTLFHNRCAFDLKYPALR